MKLNCPKTFMRISRCGAQTTDLMYWLRVRVKVVVMQRASDGAVRVVFGMLTCQFIAAKTVTRKTLQNMLQNILSHITFASVANCSLKFLCFHAIALSHVRSEMQTLIRKYHWWFVCRMIKKACWHILMGNNLFGLFCNTTCESISDKIGNSCFSKSRRK